MRIAIIVNPLIPVPPEKYGGIERIVYMLIQYLMANGHQVTLYANEHSKPGCKLIGYRESAAYGIKDLIRINTLTSKINSRDFDIVHTFGRMSNIALLMLSKLPKVISYQLPPTLSQVKKAAQIARRGTIHFTGCSDYISQQIAPFAPASTIYNGVDTGDYTYVPNVPDDAPLVFLGRIQQEKGTDIAIKAALLSGRKLVIAGNVPNEKLHQAYFEEKIKPFIDGGQVTYTGPVNDVQKNGLLGKAAAFLMPVTWAEPFGIVNGRSIGLRHTGYRLQSRLRTRGGAAWHKWFFMQYSRRNGRLCGQIAQLGRHNCRRIAEEKFSAGVIGRRYEELYRGAYGQMKNITLITTGQPSTNPRLVKEAELLHSLGYAVKVVYCFYQPWAQALDKSIIDQHPDMYICCGGHPVSSKFTYYKTRPSPKALPVAFQLL